MDGPRSTPASRSTTASSTSRTGQRSNAFYATVLGAEVVPVGTGFAYRFGSAQLNLTGRA